MGGFFSLQNQTPMTQFVSSMNTPLHLLKMHTHAHTLRRLQSLGSIWTISLRPWCEQLCELTRCTSFPMLSWCQLRSPAVSPPWCKLLLPHIPTLAACRQPLFTNWGAHAAFKSIIQHRPSLLFWKGCLIKGENLCSSGPVRPILLPVGAAAYTMCSVLSAGMIKWKGSVTSHFALQQQPL